MKNLLQEWAERAQQAGQQKSLAEMFLDMRAKNIENLPTISGEFGAIFRGAVRDIRSTFFEAAWGQPEKMSEPGEPLSPTPQITTASLLGKDKEIDLDM
jgi:hypothetical protein